MVPIAIDTFFDLDWKTFFLRRRHVVATVGAPMSHNEIVPETNPSVDDFKHGGQRVMDRIGKLLNPNFKA